MKGQMVRFYFNAFLAISFALIMAIKNLFPSWSQYALTAFQVWLSITLLNLVILFWDRSNNHQDRRKELTRIKLGKLLKRIKDRDINIRVQHVNQFISIMFGLVLIFPVTQKGDIYLLSEKTIQFLHYIFTGLAISGIWFEMNWYWKRWSKDWWFNLIVINAAVINFILIFSLHHMSVGWGEVIVAIAGLFHYVGTNKRK